jgi:hypothetical protein
MRAWPFVAAASLVLTACHSNDEAAEIESVRTFARSVEHDVSEQGPSAWRRYFADSPSFFMAVNEKLAFPNGASAQSAIPKVARAIKQIDLRWGADLRVDPLTPDLAMLATSYHEIRVNSDGTRVDENGYFTGIAERREGRWQFRNAHWSAGKP